MDTLNSEMLQKLTSPEPRLPWVTKWLLDDVWTPQGFEALTPEDYLVEGEQTVHAFEELPTSPADQFYDEIASVSVQALGLLKRVLVQAGSG